MNKQINKDIDAYRQDVWKGLSGRELIYGTAALVSGVVVILLLYGKLHIPINVATIIAMPFICLTGFNGFYMKNGQTAFELLTKMVKVRCKKPLTYKSGGQREYFALLMENKSKEEKKKEKKRKS